MQAPRRLGEPFLAPSQPTPERLPGVGQGCLLVECAFKKEAIVEQRQRSWFFQQGPTTNTYILLVVLTFWGLAG